MGKIIFVLGFPAAGKSSFIADFVSEAEGMGKSSRVIRDTDIARAICPAEGVSEDSPYYYENGALIYKTEFREAILRQTLEVQAAEVMGSGELTDYCLVEFTTSDMARALVDQFGEVLRQKPALVFMDTKMEVTIARNRERGGAYVPEEYLTSFENKSELVWGQIEGLFDEKVRLQNNGDREALLRAARNAVARF